MQADTDIRSLRLLVVEDEAIIAMLVEDALTMAGHVVVGVAESASEALAIAARETIDLALCDVRLAENDSGVTVAFVSSATTLDPADTNPSQDAYVKNLLTGSGATVVRKRAASSFSGGSSPATAASSRAAAAVRSAVSRAAAAS